GLGAGLGGRMYAALVRRTKQLSKQTSPAVRVVVGGTALSLLALLSVQLFDQPLTLGPGVSVVEWLAEDQTLQAVAIIFVLRIAATMTTILGGGTGGLFIPLAVQGVLLGKLVGLGLSDLGVDPNGSALLPVLGLAAFLAAGYRTPIAAVMFVAESTANSGSAVVPALIAAAVSQLVAGPHSVSAGQRVERLGHLEERLTMPLAAALTTDVLTVPPDATVSEFVWIHALGRRERVVPVVDGNTYLGLCSVESCAQIERDDWETTTVAEVLEATDHTANPGWSLRDVVTAMEANHSTVMAVTDGERNFIGVVLESEIVKLGEILDETGNL
ncbi:MAG: chloride channel protein, partial [Acidimicrobiales bacterium]